MLDEQNSPAVPSIPQSAPPEAPHTPGARPAAPNQGTASPLNRPEVRGMQALAHLFAAWPYLPALEYTVLPHGAVTGRIPASCTAVEAEATLRAWADALIRDPGTMFREVERFNGPWHWFELAADISVNPAKPGAQRFPFTVHGRCYPVARPLVVQSTYAGTP